MDIAKIFGVDTAVLGTALDRETASLPAQFEQMGASLQGKMQETHRLVTQKSERAAGGAAKGTADEQEEDDTKDAAASKRPRPEAPEKDVDMQEAEKPRGPAERGSVAEGEDARKKLLAEQREEIDRRCRLEEEQEQLKLLADRRVQAEHEVERLRAERRKKGEDTGHQKGAAVVKGLQAQAGEGTFDKLQPPPDATQDLLTQSQRDRKEQSRSPPPQRGRAART